jgi:DNA-binding CsgD family transcriptional regulator
VKPNILEYESDNSEHQSFVLDSFKLKKLVLEMQETLLTDYHIDYDSTPLISWFNDAQDSSCKCNTKNAEMQKNDQSVFLRHCLLQKLIRMQKEFEFINKNLTNFQSLTHREIEVIQLLAHGYNNPEIAAYLFISRYTVEQHRKNINRKLKIKSFSDLMSYVYAFDLN